MHVVDYVVGGQVAHHEALRVDVLENYDQRADDEFCLGFFEGSLGEDLAEGAAFEVAVY